MGAWATVIGSLSPTNWWKLGETSSTFANSGSNSGTLPAPQTNGVTRGVTSLITGESNAALQATGSNSSPTDHYLINMGAGKIADLIGSGSWTMLVVLKLDTTGAQGSEKTAHVFTMRRINGNAGATSSDGIWLYMNTSIASVPYEVNATRQIGGVSKTLSTSAGLAWSTSAAKVCILSYNASDGKLYAYMDGVSASTSTGDTSAMPNITEASQFLGGASYDTTGAGANTNYGVGGVFDDLVTWNRLLTQAERIAVFAAFNGSLTQTQSVAVSVFGTATAAQSVAIPVYAATSTQPWSGGRFYENDCASNAYSDASAKIKEQGTATAPSTSGGAQVLATNLSTYPHYTLRGPSSSNNGQIELTVDNDFAVCADVGAYSSNCAAAANILLYQDANNWYRLEVAKTAGGTSTLYKKSGGSESSVATVAKGVALNALARAQIYRNGSSALGIVVDGTATTYTDGSPLSGPFNVYLGAPASTGTSDNRVDNIVVTYGTKVRALGCPTGGGAAIYNSGGSLIASASESSGVATVDLAGQQFPFTGYVQVCSSLSPVTAVSDGRYPATGTMSIYGGDDFNYAPSGLDALTISGEATYSTTQTGSHNGIIVNNGIIYGVTLGFNGTVVAFTYNETTGVYAENSIGTHVDMHDSCDIQADSSGYLHFIYGGVGGATKYRKSNTTWSITDLGSETSLGENIRGSLLIDTSNNLFLVGTKTTISAYDTMVCKKRTAAGSWESTVVIANSNWLNGWYIYPCDAAFGRDGKIHATWMAYSSGTGFEHAFHAKSTDGSTWTGITGTSLTLPLTQNSSTGKLSNSATLAADGDYGVSRITVDTDGTVHMVVGVNSSDYCYIKGDPTTGWPGSSSHSFTGSMYSNHPAIDLYAGNVVVIFGATPVSGYDSLTRHASSDGGTTWSSSTMLPRPTGTREAWWWPKLTPIPGATYTKVLWQGRGTVTANKNGISPLSGAGIATLYAANLSVVIPKTQSVAIPVTMSVTQGQSVAIGVVGTLSQGQYVGIPVWARVTTAQAVAVEITLGSSTATKTQGVAITTWIPTLAMTAAVAVRAEALTDTQAVAIPVAEGPDVPDPGTDQETVFVLRHGYLKRTGMRRNV